MANQLRGLITKQLIPETGTVTGEFSLDQKRINNEFKAFSFKFYSNDSTPEGDVMKSFFESLEVPSLLNLRADFEKPVTQEEIIAAILAMQSAMSPNPDGFSSNFPQIFLTNRPLTQYLFFVNHLKLAHFPCHQACSSLLLIKDKTLLDCPPYRLISLLNTIVKIFAKVLAHRLETLLPKIISPNQTAFHKKWTVVL